MMAGLLLLLLPVLGSAHLPVHKAAAGILIRQADALREAFPDGYERRTLYLDDGQVAAVRALSGDQPAPVVVVYADKRPTGRVSVFERFDEGHSTTAVMFTINSEGTLERALILASGFPLEYLPSRSWLASLESKSLSGARWERSGLADHVDALAAARATLKALKRALAVWETAVKPAAPPSGR